MNVSRLISKAYPAAVLGELRSAGVICEKSGGAAYLVGGPVRDMLLGSDKASGNADIDIAVEDITPARLIVRMFSGRDRGSRVVSHDRFGTATVHIGSGSSARYIDFAMARSEIYEKPGRLPRVTPANIERDLFRRDFTVNSIAVCLNPSRFGDMVDPYGGMRDIKSGVLRVLHGRSFRDDPTRIFRAARFSARFGLKTEGRTEKLLRGAVKDGSIRRISRERVRKEFVASLREENAAKCLRLLSDWDVLKFVDPGISVNRAVEAGLEQRIKENFRVPTRLCVLLYSQRYAHPVSEARSVLRGLKMERKTVNEICTVLGYASGHGAKRIPSWGRIFLRLIRFRKRKITLRGKDLVKLGISPGPVFGEIFGKLAGQTGLDTRRKAIDFVKKEYKSYIK
jgi:tRNA nucleotidyltransferase/poly(A) polymerase